MKSFIKSIRTVICFSLALCLSLTLFHSIVATAYSPVQFTYSYLYDIDISYVGEPIPSYSVAEAVSGGFAPYTFSKTSGPDWVKISPDGTVSGTPARLSENGDMVICVTDDDGNQAEITVCVGATAPDPSQRTVISKVSAYSADFKNIPHIGTKFYNPEFTVTEGAPAKFDFTVMWQKKDGSGWTNQYLWSGGTFATGTYRMYVRVNLDGNGGATHVFANDTEVKVNGVAWSVSKPTINDTWSYVVATSPEIVLTSSDIAPGFTVTFDANTGNASSDLTVCSGIRYYGALPRPPYIAREGFTFDGWYTDKELTNEVNWSYGVTKNMTIYAKWLDNSRMLEELSFTIEAPAEGKRPAYTIVSARPDLYTATVDYWYLYETPFPLVRKTDTFVLEKKYALRYTITLADGYTLLSGAKITVNGISATVYGSALEQQVVLDAAVAPTLLGDVTGDGKVNALDAAFVLRYDAGLIGADELNLNAADVTGDGKVNALDAAFILRYDAGLVPGF